MSDQRTLLDPTAERSPGMRERLERPATLEGLTIGLLDISKAKGDIFLDQVESKLTDRGLKVNRYVKPTNARVAPVDLSQKISAECDVVVEALSD